MSAHYIAVPRREFEDITPVMTSNTSPEGYVASASSEVSVPRQAWCAFDSIESTDEEADRWHAAAGFPQWLMLKFPEAKTVTKFSIANCITKHNGIDAFSLQGSNDGQTFDTLGTYNNPSDFGAVTEYTVENPGEYMYYRIYVTSSHYANGSSKYAVIDQVRFYCDTIVPGAEIKKVKKKYLINESGLTQKVKKKYVVIPNPALRNLPEGYTQVEYIESTNGQYLDTTFKATNKTRVVIDAQMIITPTASGYWLFGGRIANTNSAFGVCVLTASGWGGDYSTSTNRHFFEGIGLNDRIHADCNGNTFTINDVSYTWSEVTFQTPVNMYLFGMNTNGTLTDPIPARIYSAQIYDDSGKIVRDYVPCTNSDGMVGLYDMVNGTFTGSATDTPFVAGPIAHEMYTFLVYIGQQPGSITVSPTSVSITGKSKTATATITYLGDGAVTATSSNTSIATVSISGNTVTVTSVGAGTATITINVATTDDYTGAECTLSVKVTFTISYYGTITALSGANTDVVATGIGNYALFGGNGDGYGSSSPVSAYNSSLVKTVPTELGHAVKYGTAATANSAYAIFAGGNGGYGTNSYRSGVYAYNNSLTRTVPSSVLGEKTCNMGAATINNYALFAGGTIADGVSNRVYSYNNSLVCQLLSMDYQRSYVAGITHGSYALFAGGCSDYYASDPHYTLYAIVSTFNTSLVYSTATDLSVARCDIGTAIIGNYALFAGGYSYITKNKFNTVDAYNKSLTRTVPTALSEARTTKANVTIGGYALFAGGSNNSQGTTIVDAYNSSLTKTNLFQLPNSKNSYASARKIGDYALIAGGDDNLTVLAYKYG